MKKYMRKVVMKEQITLYTVIVRQNYKEAPLQLLREKITFETLQKGYKTSKAQENRKC